MKKAIAVFVILFGSLALLNLFSDHHDMKNRYGNLIFGRHAWLRVEAYGENPETNPQLIAAAKEANAELEHETWHTRKGLAR